MPVSTRQTATAPRSAKSSQSKLNFTAKKSTAHAAKDIDAKPSYQGATVVVHSSLPHPDDDTVAEQHVKDDHLEKKLIPKEETKHEKVEEVEDDVPSIVVSDSKPVDEENIDATTDLSFQEQVSSDRTTDKSTLLGGPVEQAYQVTDKDIKEFYRNIEDSRLVKTVHQEGLTEYEKILRHFDHSLQYGPCLGLTRFRRWNRANRFNQQPPIEVLAVLLKSELGEGVEAVPPKGWKPAPETAREGVGAKAHVDDLLATRVE